MDYLWSKLKSNLQQLQNGGADEAVKEVLMQNQKKVTDLNTQGQLFKQGVDSTGARGTALEPAYTPLTISIKKRKGQPTNRVTLKDTGDFYKGTDIDFGEKDFIIINHDSKYEKLREKYGDDILGLTLDSQGILSQKIKVQLLREIKRQLKK